MNVVKKIHDSFLSEASSSPMLLNDLASMEKYIAESYSGKSLIELLQNADDAGATKFLVQKLKDKCYLIANNGRAFTEQDLLALCRSGASTKKRKSNTISYRGIGFKSVVNYAHTVHLSSGIVQATFSREATQRELPSVGLVPLIRIPHPFMGEAYNFFFEAMLRRI